MSDYIEVTDDILSEGECLEKILARALDDSIIKRVRLGELSLTADTIADILEDYRKLKSADVVEVVRCKDCVYSVKVKPTDTFFECRFFTDKSVVDTDYCSWGERCE